MPSGIVAFSSVLLFSGLLMCSWLSSMVSWLVRLISFGLLVWVQLLLLLCTCIVSASLVCSMVMVVCAVCVCLVTFVSVLVITKYVVDSIAVGSWLTVTCCAMGIGICDVSFSMFAVSLL